MSAVEVRSVEPNCLMANSASRSRSCLHPAWRVPFLLDESSNVEAVGIGPAVDQLAHGTGEAVDAKTTLTELGHRRGSGERSVRSPLPASIHTLQLASHIESRVAASEGRCPGSDHRGHTVTKVP